MPLLELKELNSRYNYFDPMQAIAAGANFKSIFLGAEPFPHIVIDNFLDIEILRQVVREFPIRRPAELLESKYQHLKDTFQPSDIESALIRNLLTELTQGAILSFLTAATGIEHLIPDPYFVGAGLHETRAGGCLAIHADFNLSKPMRIQRRLNLIVYLNENWREDWGGHLELWDRKAKCCVKRIAPIMNRAVIFQTDLDNFHGHPQPLACPENRSRRSIAMYYFIAPEKGIVSLPRRAADFRRTYNENTWPLCSRDWKRWMTSFAVDITPPIVYRALRHLAKQLDESKEG
ncbi:MULTISPECIES: 2OG-Fe(II) oxygenase [Methylomonas]|uniref:2OG-Fe(II) oxygenase n=1 Tax=Methylomonas TaxID=416 RepID=UPI001232935C|nr:2OG-Fe(II) oxygenase [Methylomonas rhizoryzae]